MIDQKKHELHNFLFGTLITNRLIKLCYVIIMTFLSPSDEEPGKAAVFTG